MKRLLAIVLLLLAAVGVYAVATRDRGWNAERVYREYDQDFRAYLAKASQATGKEIIRVELLSDRYRVPQKLTIRGTPYEIGLTIGHIAKQARRRPPIVMRANVGVNRNLADLYRRIYPQQLEIARGVAEVFDEPVERIDLRVFEQDFTTPLWIKLLKLEKFEEVTNFGKFGDAVANHAKAPSSFASSTWLATGVPDGEGIAASHHCSAASYFSNGHQYVGKNFDHASDRPTFFTTLDMAGCYKAIGHTVYELTGELIDGMNEKGFALCVASNDDGKYQSRELYPDEPAIVMWHMMQITLQTCATVDEALELLRSVRVWFPDEGNHWLLADATGKSVIVEWTPGDHKLVVFDQPAAYKLMTNAACQEGEDFLVKNCRRYSTAKPLLEKGVHNTAEMLDVVNSMRITHGPGRSLWTSVMDLNARTMETRYFKEFDRKYEFGF